jgi:hypothetical protein
MPSIKAIATTAAIAVLAVAVAENFGLLAKIQAMIPGRK